MLVTLLDKPEIGPAVMDDVIIDVFRTLYHAHRALESADGLMQGEKGEEARKHRQELIKSANLLFASFETEYIWEFCGQQYEKATEVGPAREMRGKY